MLDIRRNKKALILGVIFVLVVFTSLSVYNYLFKSVTVSVDQKVTAFKVTYNTVKELLYANDITINEEDYINVDLNQKLKNGMEIVVKKATPIIILNGNERININTTEEIVRDVVENLSIEIDDNDKIIPPLDSEVKDNLEIKIIKVDEKIEKIIDEIPYKVIEIVNENLFKGSKVEVQSGKEGLIEYRVKRIYENGELIEESIEDSHLVQQPVDSIVEKGTKDYVLSSRGKVAYKKAITMVATAYDLSYESTGKNPGDKNYGITASGTKARPGVVAVDTRVIPLGTKLYIESLDGWPDYGFAVAEDTGGAIKGNKIDLFMENRADALRFGRRKVKVYILEN